MTHSRWTATVITVVAALVAGCVALPTNNELLDQARQDHWAIHQHPEWRLLAPEEFRQADEAMNDANEGWMRNDEPAQVSHLAYMAKQRMAIAREAAAGRRAELAITEQKRPGAARGPTLKGP